MTSLSSVVTRDSKIGALAGRQHGLVTSPQLQELGLARSSISRMARRGRLYKVHHGVYSVGHAVASREATWMAAVLAGGNGAALGYVAAAKHHGIWRRRCWRIDVVAPRERRSPKGVYMHVSRTLHASDIVLRNFIPTTSISRTLLDLGDILTPHQLANVIHEAEYRGWFDPFVLDELVQRNPGRRGLGVLARALEVNRAGSHGTKSGLEDRFVALLAQKGVPEGLVNGDHAVAGGKFIEVDVAWPAAGLCVEVDGGGHKRARTKREDLDKEHLLREAGWTVFRCTEATLDRCVGQVAAFLAAV